MLANNHTRQIQSLVSHHVDGLNKYRVRQKATVRPLGPTRLGAVATPSKKVAEKARCDEKVVATQSARSPTATANEAPAKTVATEKSVAGKTAQKIAAKMFAVKDVQPLFRQPSQPLNFASGAPSRNYSIETSSSSCICRYQDCELRKQLPLVLRKLTTGEHDARRPHISIGRMSLRR
ncbi:hypothetical protein [Paraburkholderia atlantica]|uniref:hypothetical protein n=1 Tax=Paraburkholderia atlantica TaxID=2654982 RepID=UPI0012FF0043|nr:hypothetical protein [Paraburkholderia atlantica]